MRALVLVLVFSAACSWSHQKRVYGLAGVDAALFACDATQTYAASNGGAWNGMARETNPILGTAPSPTAMYGMMAFNVGLAVAITASPIPDWAKMTALALVGARVTHTVVSNYEYGGTCGI
ncbi:MAG: hypothetical protein QM831_17790 [Kofleriaceae bacterium]